MHYAIWFCLYSPVSRTSTSPKRVLLTCTALDTFADAQTPRKDSDQPHLTWRPQEHGTGVLLPLQGYGPLQPLSPRLRVSWAYATGPAFAVATIVAPPCVTCSACIGFYRNGAHKKINMLIFHLSISES